MTGFVQSGRQITYHRLNMLLVLLVVCGGCQTQTQPQQSVHNLQPLPAPVEPTGLPVIPANRQSEVQQLVQPGSNAELFRGYVDDSIRIETTTIQIVYASPSEPPVTMIIRPRLDGCEDDPGTSIACISIVPDSRNSRILADIILERLSALKEPLWSYPDAEERSLASERRELEARHRLEQEVQDRPRQGTTHWRQQFEKLVVTSLWVLFLFVMAILVIPAGRTCNRRTMLLLAALFASSLALRLAFATWGPGDLRQMDGTFITGESAGTGYGSTMAALAGWFTWLPIARDSLLVWMSLLTGALAPLFVWSSARRLGQTGIMPGLAAMAIMLHPWLVRSSGEGGRQGLVLLLGAVCFWALLESGRDWRRLSLVLGVVAAALLLRTRPEAVLHLGYVAVAVLLLPGLKSRKEYVVKGLVLVAIMTLALFQRHLLGLSGEWGQGQMIVERVVRSLMLLDEFPYRPAVVMHLDPHFTPVLFILLYGLGIVIAIKQRSMWMLWCTVSLVLYSFPLMGVPRAEPGDMQLASARYQTLTFIPFALVLAGGGGWLWDRASSKLKPRGLKVVAIAAGIVALLSCIPPMVDVCRTTSLDAEYNFLRASVRDLPQGAEVYSVQDFPFDIGLTPPTYLSAALQRPDIIWRAWPQQWQESPNPQYLATQSACWYLLHQPEIRYTATDGTTADSEADRACALAFSYVDTCAPQPFAEQQIKMRHYLRAATSRGDFTVGLYRLSPGLMKDILKSSPRPQSRD
jgi:hypothetical protein